MADRTERLDTARLTARLDLELRLIEDAVQLVSGGGSARVTIAGIRFGDELLEQARRIAARAGVSARGLYRADEAGSDLVIEQLVSGSEP